MTPGIDSKDLPIRYGNPDFYVVCETGQEFHVLEMWEHENDSILRLVMLSPEERDTEFLGANPWVVLRVIHGKCSPINAKL